MMRRGHKIKYPDENNNQNQKVNGRNESWFGVDVWRYTQKVHIIHEEPGDYEQ